MKNIHHKIIIFGIVTLVVCCKTAPEPLPKASETLDINTIITDEKFGDSSGIHTLSMRFTKNGTYDLNYGSEGWYWQNQGRYNITEQIINLKTTTCDFWQEPDKGCKNTFTIGTCKIEKSDIDLEYSHSLACKFNRKFRMFASDSKPDDQLSFDVRKFKLPPGTLRNFRGHNVITVGNMQGAVIDSVILRAGPGIEFEKRDYVINAYDGPYLKSVPKGKKVTIHARSAEKFKVKDWENYWLVISIDDSRNVWAFGEFIKY